MERYIPPFTVTIQMLMQVTEIAEKIGKISNYHSFETKPHLRKNNRIRSVWSSVAIEANSLSLDEVRSVINGKTVIGPEKDIREVKNAYQAYELLGSFDPFSLEELKRLHGIMTCRTGCGLYWSYSLSRRSFPSPLSLWALSRRPDTMNAGSAATDMFPPTGR